MGFVELADFMSELCRKLNGTTQDDALEFSADAMSLSAGHAIPPGLLINELVTNAVRCAYPGSHGVIKVSACEINGHLANRGPPRLCLPNDSIAKHSIAKRLNCQVP
jgi:two-component system, sensor histidine kinase PdtaS